MVCPQCGAGHHSEACPQPVTAAAAPPPRSEPELTLNQPTPESNTFGGAATSVAKPTSRLITFPGVTHRTVPPWRQELRERVRENQERRAQEAAAEAEAEGTILHVAEMANMSSPQLELLPQTEAADVNPLVIAALKRIERARHAAAEDPRPSYPARLSAAAGASDQITYRTEVRQDHGAKGFAASAMLLEANYNTDQAEEIQRAAPANHEPALTAVPANELFSPSELEPAVKQAVNLMVVPVAPIIAEAKPLEAQAAVPNEITKPKPRRIISDDTTDPALNYLDLVGVAHSQTADPEKRAPLFSRLVAGVIDILFVCFLSVPFAAVVELRNDSWREPRVAIFMASVAVVVMFIYLTVATALTGKTLGVKVLSMRVIDTRTRLIPTGGQAAGRAVVYIFSLATAGVCFLMALARGEGKTLHDRLSRTSVVRD